MTLPTDIPSEIIVGGRPYTVTVHPVVQGSIGRVNNSTFQIDIDAGQHPLCMRDTLLHEVIHAVDDLVQTKLVEEQVYALSGALLDTLRRNPEFTAWLVS